MFVYRDKNLPPDPEYPADLKKLGYVPQMTCENRPRTHSISRFFITEGDLIRQIADPEAEYKYKINRNDRFNVKNREAMNGLYRPSTAI